VITISKSSTHIKCLNTYFLRRFKHIIKINFSKTYEIVYLMTNYNFTHQSIKSGQKEITQMKKFTI
jgi:hypothetical protein